MKRIDEQRLYVTFRVQHLTPQWQRKPLKQQNLPGPVKQIYFSILIDSHFMNQYFMNNSYSQSMLFLVDE